MKKVLYLLTMIMLILSACTMKGGSMEENKIEYLGHASLKILLDNGKVCYVDPYAGSDYNEVADLILITHEHGDHNDIDRCKMNDDTEIIRSMQVHEGTEYANFDAIGMNIEAVEAYNKNHKKEACVGYVLTIGGKKVYIAGDTSTTDQMKNMKDMNIDIAFYPIDGEFNMDVSEAMECAELVGAKINIPYHTAPGKDFDIEIAKTFNAPGTKILKPGEFININ